MNGPTESLPRTPTLGAGPGGVHVILGSLPNGFARACARSGKLEEGVGWTGRHNSTHPTPRTGADWTGLDSTGRSVAFRSRSSPFGLLTG